MLEKYWYILVVIGLVFTSLRAFKVTFLCQKISRTIKDYIANFSFVKWAMTEMILSICFHLWNLPLKTLNLNSVGFCTTWSQKRIWTLKYTYFFLFYTNFQECVKSYWSTRIFHLRVQISILPIICCYWYSINDNDILLFWQVL